jgi:hypothetical protein
LQSLLGNGLTAELPEGGSQSQSAPSGSTNGTAPPNPPAGQICFDPALAGVQNGRAGAGSLPDQCDKPTPSNPNAGVTETTGTSVKTKRGDVETTQTDLTTGPVHNGQKHQTLAMYYPHVGNISVRLFFRSPIGVLNYLGKFRSTNAHRQPFPGYSPESDASEILGNEPYLNIINTASNACYAAVSYMGEQYCVPSTSQHTAMLMDMFEVFRNLSTQASDLNSAFTVRIAQ